MAAALVNNQRRSDNEIRVCLFTDTLGDVNGVSRFIRNMAEQALRARQRLDVLTSTRFACPAMENVHNVPPRLSRPMPGYRTLDIVWPDRGALWRLADEIQPDVVHVSTPGPVGMAGRAWALKRGVPLVGTYHTDFPAYVDHLFDDRAMTWICTRMMRRFYRPFSRLLARSEDFAGGLEELGIAREHVERLIPGIDCDGFSSRFRDETVWRGVPGASATSVKVLYVGRVSVEKNLPWLVRIWPRVRHACAQMGTDVQLVMVGDGPYRAEMERLLGGGGAVFPGFRHGAELSAMFASGDVFVFPSTTDTLGQAVMEAQASGLPVVVSDQGGPREMVGDGVTGFVLPVQAAGAEQRWVETLTRLAMDGALRRSMGAAGTARIAPMSILHSFEHFWDVHERAVREGRRGRAAERGVDATTPACVRASGC